MKIDRIYARNALATTCGTPLVVEDDCSSGRTVGILTDRDIALQGFVRADSKMESAISGTGAARRIQSRTVTREPA